MTLYVLSLLISQWLGVIVGLMTSSSLRLGSFKRLRTGLTNERLLSISVVLGPIYRLRLARMSRFHDGDLYISVPLSRM